MGDGFGSTRIATYGTGSGDEAMEMENRRRDRIWLIRSWTMKVSMNLRSLMMKVIIRKRRMLSPHWFKFSGETTTHIESTA